MTYIKNQSKQQRKKETTKSNTTHRNKETSIEITKTHNIMNNNTNTVHKHRSVLFCVVIKTYFYITYQLALNREYK